MKHTSLMPMGLLAALLTACSAFPGPEQPCPGAVPSVAGGCPSAGLPGDAPAIEVCPGGGCGGGGGCPAGAYDAGGACSRAASSGEGGCSGGPCPGEGGCSGAAGGVLAGAGASSGGGGESAASPAIVAARTADGGVALVDLASGAVLAGAPGGDPALDGPEGDVACDPYLSRVVVLDASAEDEWGEVASYALSPFGAGAPPSLGPREHEVWVDGVARVAASPSGLLVFEDGAGGPRWKLVSDSGPTPGLSAPRPASLVTGEGAGGLFGVAALTYGALSDSLEVRTATVDASGIHPDQIAPLSLVPPGDWPSARAAWAGGDIHLLSAMGGDLAWSSLSGGAPPWVALDPGAPIERLEHAVALPGGETLVALASGAADVVAVHLAGGVPACAAAIDLPGEAAGSLHFFSRGLVAAGPGRALAATSAGVFAVSVSGACPLALGVDPSFDGDALRGPLDVCPAGE